MFVGKCRDKYSHEKRQLTWAGLLFCGYKVLDLVIDGVISRVELFLTCNMSNFKHSIDY